VELPGFAAEAVNKLENALIRARGCLIPIKDESTLGVKLGVFALYNAAITIDEPAPADPFVLPLRQVQDLQLFRYGSAALQRIRLSGQLLSEHSGTLYLADGTNGFRCVPKAKFSAETGDWVEVVGFPELDRPSPLLREAVLRKVGSRPLPDACIVTPGTTLDGRLDSRRVQLTCRLQGQREDSTAHLLELQDDARMFLARLPKRIGPPPRLVNGSRVRLTGVYVGLGGDRTTGREIDSFELLLNDPSSIEVLEKPSWWSAGHAVAVAGALAAVLILAGAWIAALRRRVEQRTGELRKQVELHQQAEKRLAEQAGLLAGEVRERQQTEDILREQKGLLEREIEERRRAQQQADEATQQLLTTSRQAGMAEIATNVLHNVGNVLNSVNVSATLLADKIATSGISRVSRLADLLREHQNDLADFLTRHPKGGQLPDYVGLLANKLAEEQSFALREVRSLRENVEHIKRIVSMQQAYAKARGVSESVAPSNLMEDALRLNDSRLSKRDIVVRREYQAGLDRICLDKHKALQILVNLISNAQRACADSAQPEKQIFLRVYGENGKICFVVGDNGVGIPPENLTRIFHNGFTTRKDGHGFGLHSSALAAKELGGTLSARSDGPGKGAWFQLELPAAQAPQQSSARA
jgi:signal transduction histidine kinase